MDARGDRLLSHDFDGDPDGPWDWRKDLAERPMAMSDIRRDMFGLIDETPNLDWILLTKRPENIRQMWAGDKVVSSSGRTHEFLLHRSNVWLLYPASDQDTLEAGIDHLLECHDLAPVLGLSLEPLVGPIDLGACLTPCEGCGNQGSTQYIKEEAGSSLCRDACTQHGEDGPLIDWVIVGGESGPNARPCDLAWILDIVQQCEAAGIPYFVKQAGSNAVTSNVNIFEWPRSLYPIDGWNGWKPWGEFSSGGHIPLKHPKGADPAEWPESIRVQQTPEVTR